MQEQELEAIVADVLAALHAPTPPARATAAPSSHAVPTSSVPSDTPTDALSTQALTDLGTKQSRAHCGVSAPNKPDILHDFMRATKARVAGGTIGPRPKTLAYLHFLADHARSKGTVFKEVPDAWLAQHDLWSLPTLAVDKDIYLTRPDLGRRLAPESIAALQARCPEKKHVQIVLSDGLSTDALLSNYAEILPPLLRGLENAGITCGKPFFLRHGRVKAEDRIGEALGCDVVLLLIGERPGLGQSESMSCYAVYRPTAHTIESERTVISNIHQGGTPPVEAAAVIVELTQNMLRHEASGLALLHRREGVTPPKTGHHHAHS